MVVVTRNVDLSIGAIVGLVALYVPALDGHRPVIPIPVVGLIGLGIGLACGMATASSSRRPRASLMITLGTLCPSGRLVHPHRGRYET